MGDGMECVCGRVLQPDPCATNWTGYVGARACECGLVWEYDDGMCPTVESIRQVLAAAVAAKQEECARVADRWVGDSYHAEGIAAAIREL